MMWIGAVAGLILLVPTQGIPAPDSLTLEEILDRVHGQGVHRDCLVQDYTALVETTFRELAGDGEIKHEDNEAGEG